MKPYTDINWPYTQEDTLEKEETQKSDAKLMLTRDLNPAAREFYQKEVWRLSDIIAERRLYIKKLNTSKEDTSGKVNSILNLESNDPHNL